MNTTAELFLSMAGLHGRSSDDSNEASVLEHCGVSFRVVSGRQMYFVISSNVGVSVCGAVHEIKKAVMRAVKHKREVK